MNNCSVRCRIISQPSLKESRNPNPAEGWGKEVGGY
jgi:hypothetical protein